MKKLIKNNSISKYHDKRYCILLSEKNKNWMKSKHRENILMKIMLIEVIALSLLYFFGVLEVTFDLIEGFSLLITLIICLIITGITMLIFILTTWRDHSKQNKLELEQSEAECGFWISRIRVYQDMIAFYEQILNMDIFKISLTKSGIIFWRDDPWKGIDAAVGAWENFYDSDEWSLTTSAMKIIEKRTKEIEKISNFQFNQKNTIIPVEFEFEPNLKNPKGIENFQNLFLKQKVQAGEIIRTEFRDFTIYSGEPIEEDNNNEKKGEEPSNVEYEKTDKRNE
jgi:hypothetical protein